MNILTAKRRKRARRALRRDGLASLPPGCEDIRRRGFRRLRYSPRARAIVRALIVAGRRGEPLHMAVSADELQQTLEELQVRALVEAGA